MKVYLRCSCRGNQVRSRVVRGNPDRIAPSESSRNILTSPHIVQFVGSAFQPRNVGKCELFGDRTARGIDNENVRSFCRITRIVFGGRCGWCRGSRFEWFSWATMLAVLVESEKFGVLDDGKLSRGKSAQLMRSLVSVASI